jgi:hypothetical protein
MKGIIMRKMNYFICAMPLVLAGSMFAAPDVASAPAASCDRSCLIGFADQYMAAMVAHDPTRLPVARTVRYTENTATMPLGDGLWVGASELPQTFKIYAADPVTQQVGFFGVMKEFDKPIIFALRLKVEDMRIMEVEQVVVRDLRPMNMPNLAVSRRAFSEVVPPAERVSRGQMLAIADSYFESIEKSNGDLAPFADDCERRENGLQTTTNKTPQPSPVDDTSPGAAAAFAKLGALSCHDSMNSHAFSYIDRIRPRRLEIVDEELGLVFSLPMFRHRGNVRSIKIVGVPGVDTIPMPFGPMDLEAVEIFKIRGGKIHEIEAGGFVLPYNSKTGWEPIWNVAP